jgi:hypothetical protein
MEPPGPLGREPSGEINRLAALERHGVALATRESNGPATEDVDRGYHLELAC